MSYTKCTIKKRWPGYTLCRHALLESIIAICAALKPASTDAFVISESGIGAHSDISGLMADGVGGFLVGESLMRQDDVTAATRTLLGI